MIQLEFRSLFYIQPISILFYQMFSLVYQIFSYSMLLLVCQGGLITTYPAEHTLEHLLEYYQKCYYGPRPISTISHYCEPAQAAQAASAVPHCYFQFQFYFYFTPYPRQLQPTWLHRLCYSIRCSIVITHERLGHLAITNINTICVFHHGSRERHDPATQTNYQQTSDIDNKTIPCMRS